MHEPAVHERYVDRELVESSPSHQFLVLRINDDVHAAVSPTEKPAHLVEGTEMFLTMLKNQRVDQQHAIDNMATYIKGVQGPDDKYDVYVYRLKDDGTVYGICGAKNEPTPIKFNEPPPTPGPGHAVDDKGGLQAHATPLPNYPSVGSFADADLNLAHTLSDETVPAEPDFGFGNLVDQTPVWVKLACGVLILLAAICMVIIMAHFVGTNPPTTN